MAPQYKVSYFGIRALAEPIRLILTYAGEEFEDFRFDHDQWVNGIKQTTPFGKCPVLTVDGTDLCQSKAICRYLGRKAGLGGKDDWEDLQIDIIIDSIDDMRSELGKYFWCPDESFKAAQKDTVLNETTPMYMKKIDTIIKNNNGFLANGKLSWGDLYLLGISTYLSCMYGSDIAADYPNVKALLEKVSNLPKVKEWIEKRPNADM